MPYRALFKAGKEAKKMYDADAAAKRGTPAASEPPARARAAAPSKPSDRRSNQGKAVTAARTMGVPGSKTVLDAKARRKAMLDDI